MKFIERGLDNVSLRAIAMRLGIRQPALYHHFASKAELLDAVAEEILDRWHTERLPADGERWEAFVAWNARSMRRAMLTARDGGDIAIDTDRTDCAARHFIDSTRHVVALGQDHEFDVGLTALIRGLAPTTLAPPT